MRKLGMDLAAALTVAVLASAGCSPRVDPIVPSEAARRLHREQPVANLHADFPMFGRDFTNATPDAVSDFPRMREVGIRLLGASICPGGFEMRLGAWWWDWPAEDRTSPLARARAQIALVLNYATADPTIRIVRTRDDVDAVRQGALGLLLTMEGGGALVGDPTRVREFYDKGVRTLSLTHLWDNDLGGSGSPTIPGTNLDLHEDRGLTDQGRAVLREMAAAGMIVDLAHASPQTFTDILAAWDGPLFVSHTAIAALYSTRRNLTDNQLRAVAARGGIVGIAAQRQLLGGDHLEVMADHVVYAVRVIGAEHVALGLDMEEFATSVLPPELRDVRHLPRLTELLLRRGLTEPEIRSVLGESALTFFSRTLPPRMIGTHLTLSGKGTS